MYDTDQSNGTNIRCVELFPLPGTNNALAIDFFRRTTRLRDQLRRAFGALIP